MRVMVIVKATKDSEAGVMPSEVEDQLKPEFVSPLAAYLVSEQCELSGAMMVSGGGYFSRAAVTEGPGVFFDDPGAVTIEDLASKLGEITSLEGSAEYEAATAQTMHALSHMTTE